MEKPLAVIKPPLHIKAYWDTRTGHRKQTQGIIEALSNITPVKVTDVYLPDYEFRQVIADSLLFFRFLVSQEKKRKKEVDLLIGTGSHTHIPMILEKNRQEKIITCMTPDWPFGKFIDLCFVPEHDLPPKKDNIVTTTGPPNTNVNKKQHDPEKGLIVLGGIDRKTHQWENEDIVFQVCQIVEKTPDISWMVSTSPRTPATMMPPLQTLEKEHHNMTFLPFQETGQGWIEEQYCCSKFVWVSADSVSMIYEALSAGCQVGVISVHWKDNDNKIKRAVGLLEQQSKILSFDTWKQDKNACQNYVGLNEANKCAVEILTRWFQDRLP